jgi:hypothetical protein
VAKLLFARVGLMIFALFIDHPQPRAGRRQPASVRHFLDELVRTQQLVASGALDKGLSELLLLRADDRAEAERIASNHPAMKNGATFRVYEWKQRVENLSPLLESAIPPHARPLRDIALPADFRVIDAVTSVDHQEILQRCFAPKQISAEAPGRRDYLRIASQRGLKKLLLEHRGELIGQIELSPPEISPLPIGGEGIVVIHCLWVKDANIGWDAGYKLLVAAADAFPQAKGFATIAFNSELAWLPSSFFLRQGFIKHASLRTGRFFGETEIEADLMWRPLVENAEPPEWDPDALLEGVSFCPAYPWLAGRRLYWGHDFAYRAVVVREGLRRPEVLRRFPILGRQRVDNWHLVKVGIPRTDLEPALKLLQSSLVDDPTYYCFAYASAEDRQIIIFPNRRFEATRDPTSWSPAITYGLGKGIPRQELDFTPYRFDDEVFSDSP